MLSIKHIKKLLNGQKISDKEAGQIRDSFYMLAEIIFEEWQQKEKQKKGKEIKQKSCPPGPLLSFLVQNVYN